MPAEARTNLERFLEGLAGYVVLRNHDIWSSFARGSDLDLLVAETSRAKEALFLYLGIPLWVHGHSYVESYFYPWGQIDLWPRLEWHGAVYLPNRVVLEMAEQSDLECPKPRLAHEALISWLNFLLRGGSFKERYKPMILRAAREDGVAFKQALIYAAGRTCGERLWQTAAEGRPETSANWARTVRRAVWWRAFRRDPRNTLLRWLAHWRAEFGLRLRPPLPWVVVLGADGSGKSSVLAALKYRLVPPLFKGLSLYHWRPGLLRLSKSVNGQVTDPHGKPPRGRLASLLKLAFLFLDWTLGYWGRIVHLRGKGDLILFDRDYYDFLVDSKRYRYGGPLWLAKLMGWFIPRPDLVILLDAPPEVLQARKQEVPLEETVRQRAAYLKLLRGLPKGYVVDATKPLSEVVAEVERIIMNYVVRCNARRLGLSTRR
jgi:thymidylate kinase